ncbi:MAG: NADH-quinone oxidoreductase subunit NuoE [Kineosporiaceae bacterium]
MALTTETLDRLAVDAAAIVARYPQQRSALLPLLHLVQSEEGYVSPDGIEFCARTLGLTTAEVSAVATFYSQFKRHPNGTYTVGVCTNTLCAIMGGDAIWESLQDYLGIGHDETTEDGVITLERVECNAGCDYAPVVMVNWEFFDNQTPATARTLVDDLRSGADVAPTRGAGKVCSFKEVSRVLAGFHDGRAGEGVGAGEASLRGTVLAKQKNWTAPEGTKPVSSGTKGVDPSKQKYAGGPSDNDAGQVPATSSRGGTVAGKPAADASTPASGSGTTPPPSSGQTPKES